MGFVDQREWIAILEKEKQLRRVTAEVNWDREIGTITRKLLEKKGPAVIFESIKDYRKGICTKLFTGSLASQERLRLMLGMSKDTLNREIVAHVRKKNRELIPPTIVPTGPVKENIIQGSDIDLFKFPVPHGHFRDGGRYINTFAAILTRDPDTRVMNLGVYRGMIGKKNTIPSLLVLGGQHWGQHFAKYAALKKPMPVACIFGWDPIMDFLAGSPIPAGVCEYDVMGAYRNESAKLVRCETVDLEVPASAEMVVEGFISADPQAYELEGPYAEATGHVSDVAKPSPKIEVTCITHRTDPVFRWTIEGTLPGSMSENGYISAVQRAAIAWNVLEAAGIPGVVDVVTHPITMGVNVVVQIKKYYQGQPKQIAAALWGNSAAQYKYKNVYVVEDEIDPTSYEQLDWAFAYRVNAKEDGIIVFPGIFGSGLDPSTPLEDRDRGQLGSALWNRVLIDATRNWKFKRRKEWDNERFPPTVVPHPDDAAYVTGRWKEYGLD